MTDEEFKACLDDIRKEVLHIRMNWSAAPRRVCFVDSPEFLDIAIGYMPGAVHPRGPNFVYSTVWGIEIDERAATADVPQGIWIEDVDGIFHRVR